VETHLVHLRDQKSRKFTIRLIKKEFISNLHRVLGTEFPGTLTALQVLLSFLVALQMAHQVASQGEGAAANITFVLFHAWKQIS